MLRRLRVRTRLMTVIAVPLALLLVIAVPEVDQRLQQASDADHSAGLAGAWMTVAELTSALQQERLLSSAARAGAEDEVEPTLDAQRAVTDSAREAADGTLQDLARSSGTAESATKALEALDRLDLVRGETDAASSIVPWTDPFGPMTEALLQVQEQLGSIVAGGEAGRELATASLVARSREALSAQSSQLVATAVWGEARGDLVEILTDLRADELAYRTAYLAASPNGTQIDRRTELQANPVIEMGRDVEAILADEDDVARLGTLDTLLRDLGDADAAVAAVEQARASEARAAVAAIGDQARRESTAYAALAAVGLLAALLLALVAARSITRPLGRLSDAADELAEERLPRLVEALRNPGDEDERYLAATIEPLDTRSDDELGRLSRAFNSVQSVAVTVAAEQASLLRKGISDLYVNLARRNQSLIERQIQLLDQLEAEEQDPEVLEHLYSLDHLATRMRRNAESLLVLAGSESGPRRGRPLTVADAVRAALSEVEAYERIDLGDLAPGIVHGQAVSDVAHILAELLENATSFSAPSTRVRVEGARTGGSYQLMITDEGIGIADEQLDELNAVLRDPPVTGLALGRSLGCLVAARLAARHGVTVRLRSGGSSGVTAYVVLPRHLIAEEDIEVAPLRAARPVPASEPHLAPPRPAATAMPTPAPAAPWAPAAAAAAPPVDAAAPWAPAAPVAEPAAAEVEAPAPDTVPALAPPARLADALPTRARFDSGLRSLLDDDAAAPLVEGPVEAPPASGPTPLARRVPGATAGTFATKPEGDERVRRSPDEVRAMLARYRTGLRAGRSDDTTDAQGEGS